MMTVGSKSKSFITSRVCFRTKIYIGTKTKNTHLRKQFTYLSEITSINFKKYKRFFFLQIYNKRTFNGIKLYFKGTESFCKFVK